MRLSNPNVDIKAKKKNINKQNKYGIIAYGN